MRGERIETPSEMLEAQGLRRLLRQLYVSTQYTVRVAQQVGSLFKAPNRQRTFAAIEHRRDGSGVEVSYSTEFAAEAEQIIRWFSWRWPIEVALHDSKQHLGLGVAENCKPKTVRRTVQSGLLIYGVIVLWQECIIKTIALSVRNWYRKDQVCFAEMATALRGDSLPQL